MFFYFIFQLLFYLQITIAHNQTHSIKHFELIKFAKLENQKLNKIDDFENVYNSSLPAYLNKKNIAYMHTIDQQLHFDLISFDHLFSMILLPSIQFPVTSKKLNQSKHFNATCYSGFLKNSPLDSKLFAYFHNNLLNAIIYAFNDIYHLDEFDNQTVIMYKESDLDLNLNSYFDYKHSSNQSIKIKNKQNSFRNSIEFQKRNLLFSNTKPLYPHQPSICDVELIADHTFTEFFKHDTVRISSELFLMLMKASFIFSKIDFNFDGRPDGIYLQLSRIVIYHTSNENGYTWSDTNLKPNEILNNLGLRIQTYCLAFSFLTRDLNGTLGLAWVGDAKNSFGICSKPVLNPIISKNQFWVGNTGIVSNMNRGKIRTRAEASSTLTHEIGNSLIYIFAR